MKALTFLWRFLLIAFVCILVTIGLEIREQIILLRDDVRCLPDQVRRAMELK